MKRNYEEIVDTPNSIVVNPSNVINYWLIAVVLLTITCLLLLVAIFVQYYLKYGLTVPWYYHAGIEMTSVIQINVKNCTCYFFDDMINIKNLDPNQIKTD